MNIQHTAVREGVVAEFDGTYWGVQEEDNGGPGPWKAWGFGPIQKAELNDPRFCHKPEDMTYPSDPDREKLKLARLVPVRITTTWEV